MKRNLLVKIIASSYLVQGLLDIGAFFLPIFTSPQPFTLNIMAIIVGVFGLRAGIYLFQLSEFGRKFAMVLLSLRIAYNLFFIGWALLQSDFGFTINYFNQPIFESKSPYPFVFILLVWLLIALGAIIFLSQKKTKELFVSDVANAENDKPISNSISNK